MYSLVLGLTAHIYVGRIARANAVGAMVRVGKFISLLCEVGAQKTSVVRPPDSGQNVLPRIATRIHPWLVTLFGATNPTNADDDVCCC